jgi:predicted glycoside hydrolase/deacetylase ChbG (UPF0249 family)
MRTRWITLWLLLVSPLASAEATAPVPQYSVKLGWQPTDRVVIFHVDDVGMSHSSNRGAIRAMTEGVATSCSVMMPCGWVSEYLHYLGKYPKTDAGLHLTMTSEWREYRWGPVAGKERVPGMVDHEGCLWPDVLGVTLKASPDEVETEIRAQIDRARTAGMEITHLDSHMGTLFVPKFLDRYIKVGIELQIPILMPGGHLQYIGQSAGMPADMVRQVAAKVWEAGLPVIDDINNDSYGWKPEEKVDKFMQCLREMKPGITEFIIHATDPTEEFEKITDSGPTRKGDLDAMLDPRLRRLIEDEGIILTTWRELKQRRDRLK